MDNDTLLAHRARVWRRGQSRGAFRRPRFAERGFGRARCGGQASAVMAEAQRDWGPLLCLTRGPRGEQSEARSHQYADTRIGAARLIGVGAICVANMLRQEP